MQLADERKAQGRHDAPGREASPVVSPDSRYERGKQTLAKHTGRPEVQPTGVTAFCPEIDAFLKFGLKTEKTTKACLPVYYSNENVDRMLKQHYSKPFRAVA